MERPSVFTRKDGTAEAVSAMHFCPPVVGHEPVNDPWRKRRESGGGDVGGDAEGVGDAEESEEEKELRTGAVSAAAAFDARASDALVVTSSTSGVGFICNYASRLIGKVARPKSESPSLAVAPLTAGGVCPGGDAATTPATTLWWDATDENGRPTNVTPTPRGSQSLATDGGDQQLNAYTAFVGVASSTAIRVYPANGAAKGERHTVKKVTPEESLVAAAVVVPRDAEAEAEAEAESADGTHRPRVAAIAAASSHGRLMTWSLPGLVPLAIVGPTPPLSAADSIGFCRDAGVVLALAGGGASVAKLALSPPYTGAPSKQRGGEVEDNESGVVLYDDDVAAAADAAEAALSALAVDAANESGSGAAGEDSGAGGGGGGGGGEKKSASAGRALSFFERAKAKASDAMDKAKEKMAELSLPAEDKEDANRVFTEADLAMLFAEADEAPRAAPAPAAATGAKKAPSLPPRAAAAAATAAAAAAATKAKPAAKTKSPKASAASSYDDANRSELFRTSSGGGAASTSKPVGKQSADDIRAKYGKGTKATSSTNKTASGVAASMEQTRNKLAERGEKLERLQDKTAAMQSDADDFASLAEQLAKKNKSWF